MSHFTVLPTTTDKAGKRPKAEHAPAHPQAPLLGVPTPLVASQHTHRATALPQASQHLNNHCPSVLLSLLPPCLVPCRQRFTQSPRTQLSISARPWTMPPDQMPQKLPAALQGVSRLQGLGLFWSVRPLGSPIQSRALLSGACRLLSSRLNNGLKQLLMHWPTPVGWDSRQHCPHPKDGTWLPDSTTFTCGERPQKLSSQDTAPVECCSHCIHIVPTACGTMARLCHAKLIQGQDLLRVQKWHVLPFSQVICTTVWTSNKKFCLGSQAGSIQTVPFVK